MEVRGVWGQGPEERSWETGGGARTVGTGACAGGHGLAARASGSTMQPGTLRSIWRGGAPGEPSGVFCLDLHCQSGSHRLTFKQLEAAIVDGKLLRKSSPGGSSARRKRLSEPQDLQPPGPGRPSCPGWGGGLCCPLVAGAGWCAMGRAAGPDAQAGGRQGGAGPPRGHRGQLSEELPVLHTAGPSGSQAAAPRGLPGPRERGPTLATCSEAPPSVTQPRRPPPAHSAHVFEVKLSRAPGAPTDHRAVGGAQAMGTEPPDPREAGEVSSEIIAQISVSSTVGWGRRRREGVLGPSVRMLGPEKQKGAALGPSGDGLRVARLEGARGPGSEQREGVGASRRLRRAAACAERPRGPRSGGSAKTGDRGGRAGPLRGDSG